MGAQFDLNALSGINASAQGLAVIANNLANAETVGFKSSRTEFGDLFSGAQTSAGNGVKVANITQDFQQGTISGTGHDLDMAIDGEGFFILGDLTGKYDNVYSRNGSFKIDNNGILTTQAGNPVKGYALNEVLSSELLPVFDTTLSPINLDNLNKTPRATDNMTYDINLNGSEVSNLDPTQTDPALNSVATSANLLSLVDPENDNSFKGFPDFSTNKIVHDSLGGEHRLTSNFYKRDVVDSANSQTLDANGNPIKYTSWIVQYTMEDLDVATGQYVTSGRQATGHGDPLTPTDGTAVQPFDPATGKGGFAGMVYELQFDSTGALVDTKIPDFPQGPTGIDPTISPNSDLGWTSAGTLPTMSWIVDSPMTGATDPMGALNSTTQSVEIQVDFRNMTQFSGNYNLRGVTQNGFKVGDLVGINTGTNGIIEARYSNGRSIPVAQLGLATFTDKNAMEKLGGQTYAETFGSGAVQLGRPQQNGFGNINSGSLEYSNVDTASELVRMIQTQRTYQASAQVITTSQTLMQRVLQL